MQSSNPPPLLPPSHPSILNSAFRAFFISLASLIGITIGLFFLILILSLAFSDEDSELSLKSNYSAVILPNGQNERKKLSAKAPIILKISINGIIGTEKLNRQNISDMLVESREGIFKNNRIKALLLHINTPGGTVSDSEGIYKAIKAYKKQHGVPVYAYVDGLCASGGMYIASSCDKIFASDISLVGSVGVISPSFFNAKGLMEKIGLEAKTLYAGKGKDDMNPFRTWVPGEDDNFKGMIDYLYFQFVDLVVSNRPIDRMRLVNDYGAKVFTPEKAAEYGFIDGYGASLDSTLELLAKEIGIEDNYYQFIRLDRKIRLSDLFSGDSSLVKGKITHQVEWPLEMDPQLMNQFLYLYLPR